MIQTKVRIPLVRPGVLPRPRLVAAVQQAVATAPLVLVSGVAGAGKTTVIRQWAAEQLPSTKVAWMTVDARDNDPLRFWRYVAAATSVVCPGLSWTGADQVSEVDGEDPDLLAAQLTGCGPLVLVLDDMHFLVEPLVLEQLDRFAGSLPDPVRLLLVSRNRPPLRLARRSAAAQLAEIHGSDLLFTPAETAQVLTAAQPATEDGAPAGAVQPGLVTAVQSATGGWPIAVTLTAQLSGSAGPDGVDPVLARRARHRVADYLTEEVLRSLPDDVQQFLLDTSVLDDFTVAACDAVRDAADSSHYMDLLERHDAFLTPLDSDGAPTWRHHGIVRDHLRRAVEENDPQRLRTLNLRAAGFYARSDPERAVAHAFAGGAPEYAADLVEQVIARDHGPVPEPSLRLHWFEALGDELVGARPKLREAAIVLALLLSRPDLTTRWIRARRIGGEDDLDALLAEFWRTQSVGDQPRMFEVCRLAAHRLTPQSPLWAAVQHGVEVAAASLGDWSGAVDAGLKARLPVDGCPVEAMPIQEGVRGVLAMTYARAGDHLGAEQALRELDSWLAASARLGYVALGYRARAVAVLAYYRGDYATAATWDPPGAPTIAGVPFFGVEWTLDLLRVRRATGDADRAAELLPELRETVSRMADAGMFPAWLDEEEAALRGLAPPVRPAVAAARARPDRARPDRVLQVEPLSPREVEVLRMLRSEFSLPEIAGHLYVSYNTVKTHTRVVYRKLGVNGRSAAVARGRQLGYL